MQPDPRGSDFSVGDSIWEEIKHISETQLKTCGYAPYIMRVILKVTRRNFGMDVKCDTSGVSTFKYNQCTLVKVKRKIWEINSKRKGQIKDKLYKRN